MRCLNIGVCEDFLKVRGGSTDPLTLQLQILLSLNVGVFRTVVYQVTSLFAAEAPLQMFVVVMIRPVVTVVVVFILGLLVFRELAPGGLFGALAAAPPHLAGPLRLVCSAGPVKVLIFFVVALTVEAQFDRRVIVVPSLLQAKFVDPDQQ